EPPASTAVIRARSAVAAFAMADHDARKAFEMAQSLATLEIMPATAERSVYEVALNTSQNASKYFTYYGHVNLAIQTHEALAAKFPGSTLARIEQPKADRLRA